MTTNWRQDAACRGADLSVFFPDPGVPPIAAAAVCHACPVRAACLEEALRLKDVHGFRGGTTGEERARLLPARNGVRRVPVLEVYALADRGWELKSIAAEVGVHVDSVRRVLKQRADRREAVA